MEEILNNWLQEKPRDKFDKELHKYTYYDLMEFAEHYHTLKLHTTIDIKPIKKENKIMDLQHIINCLTALYLDIYKKNEASTDIENILKMLLQYKQEQDKKLYSEEEVLRLIFARNVEFGIIERTSVVKEWFEKFKKK